MRISKNSSLNASRILRVLVLILIHVGAVFFISPEATASVKLLGSASPIIVHHQRGNLSASYTSEKEISIATCDFANVDAVRLEAVFLDWSYTKVQSANFSNGKFNGSTWKHSTFVNAEFRGAELREAAFDSVLFDHCNFDSADLRGTKFTNSIINGCTFNQTLFNDATQLPFDSNTAISIGMIYVR